MKLSRRHILGSMAGAALAAPGVLRAQERFPARPVRLVVPFPPAGPTDLVGRLVAQRLRDAWQQPVVVENRPGASGTTGSQVVAQSAPDGYTLVLGNNASHGAYELLNPRQAPYQTLRDFAPVALVGLAQLIMIVNANVPARNMQEFVAYARANPGRLNYASAAFGSATHFACELLKLSTGITMEHVPFNGAAPALLALANGDVHVYMGGVSSIQALVADGRARAIAAVSDQRVPQMPDLPTTAEQGLPGLSWDSWYGLLAPARVPTAILDKINADARQVLDGQEVYAQLQRYGMERKLGTRAEFETAVRNEIERTARVVRDANIRVE